MTALAQGWLVARREILERSRSRAFQVSLVVVLLVVVAAVALPAALEGERTKDVGMTGTIPAALPTVVADQGEGVGTSVRVRRFGSVAAGQEAVRDGDVDVLVVDAQRLEWPGRPDEELRAVVAGAIQLVAVQARAEAAGISLDDLEVLVTPVPLDEVELGSVAGRSPDDETAAMVMTLLLLVAITTYGSLVLSGVVEEKTSRVVEVLLARMPARTLLAGKVTGIGLLGLAQISLTALAALVATAMADSVDIPAVRGEVLAWVVAWFVLGYALYAMAYGALGSLASRPEDAQSVVGPVQAVLVAGYFASFAAIGSPDRGWAQVLSFLPPTAPLTMPIRIAMGVTAWWEPVLAAVLTVAAIVALVRFGGRVYAGAILRSGPTLKVREALRAGSAAPGPAPEGEVRAEARGPLGSHP